MLTGITEPNRMAFADEMIITSRFCSMNECVGITETWVDDPDGAETDDDGSTQIRIYNTTPLHEGDEPKLIASVGVMQFTAFVLLTKAAGTANESHGGILSLRHVYDDADRAMSILIPDAKQRRDSGFTYGDYRKFLDGVRDGNFDKLIDVEAFYTSGYRVVEDAGRLTVKQLVTV